MTGRLDAVTGVKGPVIPAGHSVLPAGKPSAMMSRSVISSQTYSIDTPADLYRKG